MSRMPSEKELETAYAAAFESWSSSEDQRLWDASSADGLASPDGCDADC